MSEHDEINLYEDDFNIGEDRPSLIFLNTRVKFVPATGAGGRAIGNSGQPEMQTDYVIPWDNIKRIQYYRHFPKADTHTQQVGYLHTDFGHYEFNFYEFMPSGMSRLNWNRERREKFEKKMVSLEKAIMHCWRKNSDLIIDGLGRFKSEDFNTISENKELTKIMAEFDDEDLRLSSEAEKLQQEIRDIGSNIKQRFQKKRIKESEVSKMKRTKKQYLECDEDYFLNIRDYLTATIDDIERYAYDYEQDPITNKILANLKRAVYDIETDELEPM